MLPKILVPVSVSGVKIMVLLSVDVLSVSVMGAVELDGVRIYVC